MSHLYFMFGISNFDALWFILYRFTVEVCEWDVKMYVNLATFETM